MAARRNLFEFNRKDRKERRDKIRDCVPISLRSLRSLRLNKYAKTNSSARRQPLDFRSASLEGKRMVARTKAGRDQGSRVRRSLLGTASWFERRIGAPWPVLSRRHVLRQSG